MSSFCQNVDGGSESKLTGGSPGRRSSSAVTSSSSCGLRGFLSEYDFRPKRPVTSITSRCLPVLAFLAAPRARVE
jgi:hypothetical protein